MTAPTLVDCVQARSGLWPPERPRLDGQAELAAREHVRRCPACVHYFAQDRRLLEALDELRARRAPRHVREKILDTLARERTGDSASRPLPTPARQRRPFGRRTALALFSGVGAVAAVAWGLAGTARATPGVPGAALAEDYVRRAVAEQHLVTENPREVAQFLMRELGIQAGPLPRSELHIEGVEICLIDGRRGALIVYRLEGRRVSHYLIPRALGPDRDPALAHSDPTGGVATIPVLAWASGAVEHALVGEFPVETLLRLARGGNEITR